MTKLLIALIAFLPIALELVKGDFAASTVFIAYVLLFLGLMKLSARYFVLLAVPFWVAGAAISAYTLLTASRLSANVIFSLFETDHRESIEFFGSIFFIKYAGLLLCFLCLPCLFLRGSNRLNLPLTGRHWLPLATLAIIYLATFHFYQISTDNRKVVQSDGLFRYFPAREAILIKQAWFENKVVIEEYNRLDVGISSSRNPKNDISVIFIIGESARKISMGLYGSRYATTPNMDKLRQTHPNKISVHSNMVSASAFTRVSVPSLLSLSRVSQFDDIASYPSIYRLLNHAGVDTLFLSNRSVEGFNSSLYSALLNDNHRLQYNQQESLYDHDLLTQLPEYLNANTQDPKFITLHLDGSHYKYKQRYPELHNCFVPDIPEAHYLSSIRYNDQFLHKTLAYADKINQPIVMVYTSDHGEYVNDDGDELYGHGYKRLTQSEIEIPLIFLFNDSFVNKYPLLVTQIKSQQGAMLSHDNISQTLLALSGIINDNSLDQRLDLTSTNFRQQPRYIVDRELKITPLDQMIWDTVTPQKTSNIIIENKCAKKVKKITNNQT